MEIITSNIEWQTPNATKKKIYEKLKDTNFPCVYVAYPWANIIEYATKYVHIVNRTILYIRKYHCVRLQKQSLFDDKLCFSLWSNLSLIPWQNFYL